MQLIIVSDRLATARTLTIGWRHLMLAGFGFGVAVLGLSSLVSFVTLRHATELRLPVVQDLVLAVRNEEAQKTQAFAQQIAQQNLSAMAVKIGELQAQLLRLDTLGERLGGLVGIKPQEFKAQPAPGRGGPLTFPSFPPTESEVARQVSLLSMQVESRSDMLSLIESELIDRKSRLDLVPSTLPVDGAWNVSGFGWRSDPMSGHRAMHEGVDFPADTGTPIVAAAAGIVSGAEYHPQFGNLVEIDHGHGLSTRYAHTSKMLVVPGTFVRRGQKIAEVGSTGRSTGPHLHFEVRVSGTAQNPNHFLNNARNSDLALALAKR